MIWAYGAAGLVTFVIVMAIVVAAVQSVHSKGTYRVELEAPEYFGYGGHITARFDTEKELLAFLRTYRNVIMPQQPAEPSTGVREALDRGESRS